MLKIRNLVGTSIGAKLIHGSSSQRGILYIGEKCLTFIPFSPSTGNKIKLYFNHIVLVTTLKTITDLGQVYKITLCNDQHFMLNVYDSVRLLDFLNSKVGLRHDTV